MFSLLFKSLIDIIPYVFKNFLEKIFKEIYSRMLKIIEDSFLLFSKAVICTSL